LNAPPPDGGERTQDPRATIVAMEFRVVKAVAEIKDEGDQDDRDDVRNHT
jgi:hypothetical protein